MRYKNEIIQNCVILLIMEDIHLYKNRNVLDHLPLFNCMVLCSLLHAPDAENPDLMRAYRKIIQRYSR